MSELRSVANELKRYIVTRTDNIKLDDLTSAATKQICSAYLYEDGNPGEKLAAQIVAHFGKEWLTVEDIEGPEGYASKVTLTFNDQPHTIYYDEKDEPIIYKSPLPKQVLFVEQFLRMVKEGGKVFTVLDTGVLSNLEDEYIRRFFFKSARWWATVEFFHGAFKAARANVKTAIVLLERRNEPDLDYEIYGAIPQYLGYNLRKQDTPPIFENDLGSVVCDFSAFLSGQRPRQHDSCPWSEKRYCCFGDEVGMDRSKDPLFSQLEFGSEEQEVLEVDGISTGE